MKRRRDAKGSHESVPRVTRWGVVLIFLAGLAVRLLIAPWGGHPGDLPVFLRWADSLGEVGYLNIYAVSDANYPPLGMAVVGLAGGLADLLGAPDGSPLQTALIKLPAMLADLGIAWLIWRRSGSVLPLVGAVFNPALIYLSAWWGQLESITMLCGLASVFAALDGRPLRSGLWLGAGAMVKLQAAAITPVLIVLVLGGSAVNFRNLLKFGGGIGLAATLVMSPFVLTGQTGLVLARMVALVAGPGWLTVNALNFWYLVSGGAGNWAFDAPLVWADTAPLVAGISPRLIGLVLMGVWTAGVVTLMILRLRARPPQDIIEKVALLAGALLVLGTFLWPTQSHERYAFGAVVLLAAAKGSDRRHLGLYVAVSFLHLLNLLWAAPFHLALLGWFAGNTGVGMVAAIGMIGCAGWGIWSLPASLPFTRN